MLRLAFADHPVDGVIYEAEVRPNQATAQDIRSVFGDMMRYWLLLTEPACRGTIRPSASDRAHRGG